jgi:hypothetical protein
MEAAMNRRTMRGLVSLLAVAGLVGAACSRDASDSAGGSVPGQKALRAQAPEVLPGAVSGTGASESGNTAVSGVAPLPELGARVIKTAALGVSVAPGTFQEKFQEATLVAGRHGGFVSSSNTAEGRLRSGTIVVRVPASDFETALGELRRLGRVRSQSLSGEDVTGRVVDLQARLRNWEAQEAVLLRLMAKATSIEDSIVVQRQLQDVQLQIEELKGQLRALADQTEFSTISLSLSEAGFVPPRKASGGLTFSKAWRLAVHGFVAVFAAVLVGLGFLIPIALLGLVVLLVVLGFRRFRRVPTAS